jgi:hypothetical protein
MGGAGDDGPYKVDFVRALQAVGMSNVRMTNPPYSLGKELFGETTPLGFIADAAFVTQVNEDLGRGMYLTVPSAEKTVTTPGEQYNLIGYSYGAAIMAQTALTQAEVKNRVVDNLVLIGAPINQSLVDRLKASPNIKNVIYINLTAKGDPVYPGMSDFALAWHTPRLYYQMQSGKGLGHFYYSLETAEGTRRREELARQLKEMGLR